MVLKGGDKGFGIPLNAPLYPFNTSISKILYSQVKVGIVLASIDGKSVEPLLPEGVDLAMEMAAFWVSEYGISNVGRYREAIVAIPVRTSGVDLAYYIPYIYVTNDAAMAGGREILGAPKKIGDVKLWVDDYGIVHGTLNRGGDLMKLMIHISNKLSPEQLDSFSNLMPRKENVITFPLLSVRTLPPLPDGTPGIAQLILWYARFTLLPKEYPELWIGTAALELHGTPNDPLNEITVTQIISGFYMEGNMELGVTRKLRDWILEWK
ncbi:acetoacetate decarboxylase family protein [Vulcanisaeta thermophila]|uniref:acetoacetate decarboxylase family protein n=1 Tax=Vulcanisaeta thermophila TaxID=867917 RepID=UPI0008529A4D|nr:acetoacetate decarboxylase family protein [Vulcanisaeta thermophila]